MYCCSLVARPYYWDTGEAQTVPWIFGIMHPTGFPVFTMSAGIFAHAFPFGTVAWRIALFSALAMTATAFIVYRFVRELDGDPWSACTAAFIFAFGGVAWTRGTRAEVHALAVMLGMASLYAGFVWLRTRRTHHLALCALYFGLGVATHPIVVMLAPALALLVTERLCALRPRAVLLCALALFGGVSCYAYLPARSAAVTAAHLDPTRSLGLPPGGAFWDDNHPQSLKGLQRELTGSDYGAGGAVARMAHWNTYRTGIPSYAQALFDELTPIGIILALTGLIALWQREDASSVLLTIAFAVPTAFALAYTIESDPKRYYLLGFAVVSVFAGMGSTWLMRATAATPAARILTAFAIAALFVGVNHGIFAQRSNYGAEAVIDAAAANTPDDAILVSPWIYATPLAYGSYVEHRLGHRILVTAWLSEVHTRVPAWIKRRPVFVVGTLFGEVKGFRAVKVWDDPALYRIMPSPARRHLR